MDAQRVLEGGFIATTISIKGVGFLCQNRLTFKSVDVYFEISF